MPGSASNGVGLVLTGELLSVREGRSYQGQSGMVTPGEITVLVHDEVFVIRFPTVDAARAVVGDAPERAPITLRVAPRMAGPKDATARSWVEWRGLVPHAN
jgi:hypothetical protein